MPRALARQGGNEFLAVLRNVSCEDAVAIAERIRFTFAAAVMQLPDSGRLSNAEHRRCRACGKRRRFERLMPKADEALYRSKREGRNRAEAFCENQQAA
ncbi:diguanylate cyclase [Rhizobium leguminosarum]|uniref:diguanylate cyclase n=1 Tax=Rhizobium leguminosarum TaxID=384 RepID=UPI001C94FEDA|nr:diguanylate cyclase [Rhizobium leguminosarum]MBY5401493.1 diguanylate cyclase [Rhizobium leguminosarum]